MISVGATVTRGGQARDIPISRLVPGDIVALAAGDMIPADVRVLTAKDLFVNQSTLTGESFPVEKFEVEKNPAASAPAEFTSVAFLGTSVESGSGTAVVVATGQETYLGGTASFMTEAEPPSQTAIPTDDVDPEQVARPRPWDLGQLTRFIVFIGPCSSLFDYTTYFMMLYVFNCWDTGTPEAARRSASLFQTGWFVESLLTQTLIIYIIRTNKIPFLQSRPSWPLMVVSAVVMAVGVALPFSSMGQYLGFTRLPPLYWPLLGLSIVGYAALTQGVKAWLLRIRWI